MVGINNHTITDNRELALHQTGRQQCELVAHPVNDQRMAGIVTALIAHHDIGTLAEPVHDLALALVAPLRADDNHISH